MNIKPVVVYTTLTSFIVGLIFGGILVGAPREAFAAVLVGVVCLLVVYSIYLWIGGEK